MSCKCLGERSGASTFLQLLLHKDPLNICLQLIYLGWFQYSDIPICLCGPGLTCAAPSPGYTCPLLVGTRGQALFTLQCRFGTTRSTSVSAMALCGSAGTSGSRPWGSQITPRSQNRPRVPKPSKGLKTTPRVPAAGSLLSARVQLGQQGAEPGAHPGPSHSWALCRSQSQPSRPWLSALAAAGY